MACKLYLTKVIKELPLCALGNIFFDFSAVFLCLYFIGFLTSISLKVNLKPSIPHPFLLENGGDSAPPRRLLGHVTELVSIKHVQHPLFLVLSSPPSLSSSVFKALVISFSVLAQACL